MRPTFASACCSWHALLVSWSSIVDGVVSKIKASLLTRLDDNPTSEAVKVQLDTQKWSKDQREAPHKNRGAILQRFEEGHHSQQVQHSLEQPSWNFEWCLQGDSLLGTKRLLMRMSKTPARPPVKLQ